MKWKLHQAAERDLDDAAGWYGENSIEPRMAVRFLLEARAAFERIVESPEASPKVHGDVRRFRLRDFPAYSVFYRIDGDDVLVLAVFHGRRRPAAWKRRR